MGSAMFLVVVVGARGQENTLSSLQTNWMLSPVIGMLGPTLLHVIAESDKGLTPVSQQCLTVAAISL